VQVCPASFHPLAFSTRWCPMPLPLLAAKRSDRNDLAACRALLKGGSRSFHAASLLLPARVRDPASALYAFCRIADDAVDHGHNPHRALIRLHERLDGIYSGQPENHPADRAFARVVEHYAIPQALPQALLEGFAWDLELRRYQTIEDLHAYAARVAGCVGIMMTLVMRRRDPAVLSRASELGIAMQLTNIARDVGEDARAGRVYLPVEWLAEAGLDPDDLIANPRHSPALASVVQRLLAHAEALYARAEPGISALPADCRPAIHAARILYREIGRELARSGLDCVSRRTVVPASRKLSVLCNVLPDSLMRGDPGQDAPLASVQFLIDPVPHHGEAASQPRRGFAPISRVRDRAIWVIDLFERLERRAQLERAG
jgi:15-cis-phytoene synthase